MQVLVTLLVVVVGVNVAILVYARTATRQADIAVRTALGATRRRIVAQLVVEALVLSSAAALLGLLLAKVSLQQASAAAKLVGARVGGLPFWMNFTLSSGTILYTAGLAVLAGAIAGVVPALKSDRAADDGDGESPNGRGAAAGDDGDRRSGAAPGGDEVAGRELPSRRRRREA